MSSLVAHHKNHAKLVILSIQKKESLIMANERWISPFPCTLAFNLFKKHFTELNNAYWAFVPVSSTIISHARKALVIDSADPKSFFLVHDEEDKRIAPTFGEWRANYSEFANYTRLNMIMLLSSCFETYLRTVVSNAFESKPGVIIMCAGSVDGIFLLKNRSTYGNINDKNYQFSEEIDEICRGDWAKRFSAFEKYFGKPPENIIDKTTELNELRIARNNIGHFIGRTKEVYSAPALLSPISAIRISHLRMLKYFKLINQVARELDNYLKTNYIGSYDIIKFYFQQVAQGEFNDSVPGIRAREFQHLLGSEGFPPVGNEYYRNIVSYCDLENQNATCIYSKKACLKEINRQLTARGTPLICGGHAIRFGECHFKLFIRSCGWKGNSEYCQKNSANSKQNEYRYSQKAISEIVERTAACPETIINALKTNDTNGI